MNKRVHQIAKERGLPAKDVLERLQAAGLKVKAVSSSVDEADARRVLGDGAGSGQGQAPSQAQAAATRTPAAEAAPAPRADDGRAAPRRRRATLARRPPERARTETSSRAARSDAPSRPSGKGPNGPDGPNGPARGGDGAPLGRRERPQASHARLPPG